MRFSRCFTTSCIIVAGLALVVGPAVADERLDAEGRTFVEVPVGPSTPEDLAKDATRASLYYFFPGETFFPDVSTTVSTYATGGCIFISGGGSYLVHPVVNIPEGIEITAVRLYYNDTSASNILLRIREFDGAGGNATVVEVTNDASTGYGSVLSSEVSYVVSPRTRSLILETYLPDHSSAMTFCGARIFANND